MTTKPIFHELLTTLDHGIPQNSPALAHRPSTLQRAIPLDLGSNFHSLFYPTNRLIYSPHTIDTAQLQPFLDGTREVILVCTQNGKMLPATLQAVHSSYLIVDTPQSLFRRQRGDTVLVVFPVAPQQHYVLQTSINKVYAFRLELEYRDPRYDVRHAIPLAAPVTLHQVPTTLITAIAQQQGHIVRQITLTRRDAQGMANSVLTELFCPADSTASVASPATDDLPVACALRDISLGGTCLTVGASAAPEVQPQQLVRLTIPLPCASRSMPYWSAVSLTLQLLGVVRGVSHAPAVKDLHIRFLKRLPPELDSLLWHLEGRLPVKPTDSEVAHCLTAQEA